MRWVGKWSGLKSPAHQLTEIAYGKALPTLSELLKFGVFAKRTESKGPIFLHKLFMNVPVEKTKAPRPDRRYSKLHNDCISKTTDFTPLISNDERVAAKISTASFE